MVQRKAERPVEKLKKTKDVSGNILIAFFFNNYLRMNSQILSGQNRLIIGSCNHNSNGFYGLFGIDYGVSIVETISFFKINTIIRIFNMTVFGNKSILEAVTALVKVYKIQSPFIHEFSVRKYVSIL